MDLDYKKHSLMEYIHYALEQYSNDNANSLLLGYSGSEPVQINRYSKTQLYPDQFNVVVHSNDVIIRPLDKNETSRFNNISYTFRKNFEMLYAKNFHYSANINPKTGARNIRQKEYQLLNRRLSITPNIHEYEHRMKNYSLTERRKRTGQTERRVRFCTVLYQNGIELNRTYNGISVYEEYNKKGLCTYVQYEFNYKGASSYIQMKVHKNCVHLYVSCAGTKEFQLKPIIISNLREAGIEYLYNEHHRFNADLMLTPDLHSTMSFGLEKLVHTIMNNQDDALFRNAARRLNEVKVMEV